MPHGPPHHIPDSGQNLGQNAPLQPRGLGHCLRSHGHHMMIVKPCTTQATLAADLGPEGSNPLSFPSISILLHANASLIAPQQLCMYLLPFPTWRLMVCTPVSYLHPHLLLPCVDSCC